VQKLLKQADAYKGKKEYAGLLHKADSLAADDMATLAMINQKLGSWYFSIDPDKSIYHFQHAVSYHRLTDNKPGTAIGLQNLAFAFDEGKFNIPAAIPYAEQAFGVWKELNDTLQMANMYKYIGLLQGKTSRAALARENIGKAIELYRAKNYEAGVAVSWHNLAVVHQFGRRYDSAFAYIQQAKNYWQGKDSSRLFELNNLALQMHLAVNNLDLAGASYSENLSLYHDAFFWRDQLTFYSLAAEYLRRAGDEKAAAAILEKYNKLHANLQKKGVIRGG
jgi:tetratricopeptide (TPR) repeat protein